METSEPSREPRVNDVECIYIVLRRPRPIELVEGSTSIRDLSPQPKRPTQRRQSAGVNWGIRKWLHNTSETHKVSGKVLLCYMVRFVGEFQGDMYRF